ncbi:MAG: zf-HC2 domain-containing protein [Archangium sp.]|nr:zf-HC2 domain-containing protein [Archangium sp.]
MNAGVHQYEDKLLDYAYGELPAHEAAAVDAHVRTCAKCSQALEQIKGVRSVFAPLPMVAAPDAGLESLLAYADQHARRAKAEKQAPWRRWIFAFASAAALLVVGVVAVRASEDSPQSAMDIVAGAEKETRKLESSKTAPAPVAASPAADVAPAEPKEEPQVWDERTGKRGLADPNSDEYANKTDALREKAPQQKQVRLDDSLAKNDKSRAEKPSDFDAFAGKKGGAGGENAAAAVARPSEGKRQAPAKEAEARGGLVADYANSRGGYVGDVAKDAKKVAKTEEKLNLGDELNDGTSVKQSMTGTSSPPGYGVSAGAGSYGSGTVTYGQVVDAPKGNAEQGRSQAGPPPPPVQVAPAAVAPSQPAPMAPQKAKVASNYGIMPRPSANEAAAEDDAPQAVTESSVGDSSLRRQRDQQLAVEAQLGQARAAANQGDRRGQVAAAVRALSAGATGYARAEALKSACDGYEALGEYDRAQQFCDLLISEFRGTAAAQQVAQRRKAQLKAPAPAARKSVDFESEDKKPADLPAAAH